MAHRRSAPPTSQRSLRDSVGSLDYLSESQVDLDSDDEEAQSEVGVVISGCGFAGFCVVKLHVQCV